MSEHKLPTRSEALNILEKAGCPPNVIAHCKTVSKFAVRIAKASAKHGYKVNVQLVEVSGLLHDVGRSKTHCVDHALIGGEIAQSFGLPSSIVKIIERHAGGGIPKDEAQKLGWPIRDYLPQTLEEKIVCYADKRVEGLRTVSLDQALKVYVASLGKDHPTVERIRKLHVEIVAIAGDIQ